MSDDGIIDYYADIEEGYNKLSEILNTITNELNKVNEDTDLFASEISNRSKHPSSGSASHLRKLSHSHAKILTEFNQRLFSSNNAYSNIANALKDTLENIINFINPGTNETEEYKNFISTLNWVKEKLLNARKIYCDLISTMASLPKIERFYNRAKDDAIGELQKFIDNMSITISSLDRALNIRHSNIK